jgi:hypothetical protein
VRERERERVRRYQQKECTLAHGRDDAVRKHRFGHRSRHGCEKVRVNTLVQKKR